MAYRFTTFIAALATAACLGGVARADDETEVDARMTVEVGASGNVTAIRNHWLFDEEFSGAILDAYDDDGNGALDETELANFAASVSEIGAKYNGFQFIAMGKETVSAEPVADMKALLEDGRVALAFTAVPARPVAVGASPVFGVFDPTFAMSFSFDGPDAMTIDGAPQCTATKEVPDPDTVFADQGDAFTEAYRTEDDMEMARLLAPRMQVTCAAAETTPSQ